MLKKLTNNYLLKEKESQAQLTKHNEVGLKHNALGVSLLYPTSKMFALLTTLYPPGGEKIRHTVFRTTIEQNYAEKY